MITPARQKDLQISIRNRKNILCKSNAGINIYSKALIFCQTDETNISNNVINKIFSTSYILYFKDFLKKSFNLEFNKNFKFNLLIIVENIEILISILITIFLFKEITNFKFLFY